MLKVLNPENINAVIEPQKNIDQGIIEKLIEELNMMQESIKNVPDKFTDIADKLNPIPELIEVLKPISKVCYVVTHPIIIWDWLISVSFWLSVGICTTSLIFYVATDSKKCARITTGTMVAYTLLKAIDGAIK